MNFRASTIHIPRGWSGNCCERRVARMGKSMDRQKNFRLALCSVALCLRASVSVSLMTDEESRLAWAREGTRARWQAGGGR
jgi:hypothetical protein